MRKTSSRARLSRKTFAFALALGTAAAVAGASWSAQGNGTAKAQAGRLQPVTATAATPSEELFPGGSADSALTLNNPNPVAMTVSAIVGNGPITSDSAACNEAGHGVTFVDQTGAWEVAKSAMLAVSLPDSVQMSLGAADACQGATFTIPVAVTASVTGQGGEGTPITTTTSTTAPARLEWSPPNFIYSNTEVNTTSPQAVNFTLRNAGGASATFELGTLGNPEFIVEQNTCNAGTVMAPGQYCGMLVRFRPAAVGQRSGVLEARLSGAASYTTATLSGYGATPGYLAIQPSSRDFGSYTVGSETPTFGFQVINTGGSPATNFTSLIQGVDPNSFLIRSNTCGTTVAAGQTCFVYVSFRPTHSGSNAANLRLGYATGNNTGQVATAALTGTGV